MNIESIKELLIKSNLEELVINNLIDSLRKKEYGLIFEDEELTADKLLSEITFKVKERKDLSIINDQLKEPNLLIEGDNLNSLAYLIKENEQVDVIYIDPPYNTGNKTFTYNDSFKEKGSHWGHSDWLVFMNKRLLLAKELLKDDGVIFLSIDDNEQAQLKLLMDKVFGEQNFLGTIIQNKGNAQNDAHSIQKNHEYVHVYTKSNARLYHNKPILKKAFKDEHGWFYKGSGITTGGVGGALNICPTLGYTIYYNPETEHFIGMQDLDVEKARTSNNVEEIYTDNKELTSMGFVTIRPPKRGTKLGAWTWGIDNFNAKKKNILITKNKNKYSVIQKKYVDEDKIISIKGTMYYSDDTLANSRSILDFPSAQGTSSLTDIFNYKAFNNPKNIAMLKYFIGLHTNKNATVLDFFAGSGSTGQAVMELNREDGGNRKFILCTNNEITKDVETEYLLSKGYIDKKPKTTRGLNYKEWLLSIENFKQTTEFEVFSKQEEYQKLGICRSITYERLKRLVLGYTNKKDVLIEGNFDNLKYLKTE